MYAHAAPWNAANFGRANSSSGCVGMSDADAKDFFAQSQVGDPFEVVGQGSKGNAEIGNGYGEWNLSWDEWKAKSAVTGTPRTAERAPAPPCPSLTFVQLLPPRNLLTGYPQ